MLLTLVSLRAGRRAAHALIGAAALAMTSGAFAQAPTAPSPATVATSHTAAPASSATAFRIRPVDDAWRAALPRDAARATQAYLDRLPADVVARSNAYYEGGYWLRLWNWLAGIVVAMLLLETKASAAFRDWAERRLRRPLLRDAGYGVVYAVAGWLLTLPLAVYEGYVREHAYAMSTQTSAAWFGEQLVMLAVGTVITALAVALLYAVLRRAGAMWWLWGTVAAMALLVAVVAVAPIWIEPLFNTYKPVEEGPIKTAVLAMARANGVPVDNVYVFDASRQTTRVSANVSGLFGTAAVRLNDNLLRRSSKAEVRAVMGHEIGHYAMNHVFKSLVLTGVVLLVGFAVSQWAMNRLLARYGARWRLRGVSDVASLPLLAAVLSTFFLLATPVQNTITRTQEAEADIWGLNLAREPHGEAEVLLKLVEYLARAAAAESA